MGRSRFPGKPFKFQNRKRISVLFTTTLDGNERVSVAGGRNEEVEGPNEADSETPKAEELPVEPPEPPDCPPEPGQDATAPAGSSQGCNSAVTRSQQKMQAPASIKKSVTFGDSHTCSEQFKPLKKVPSKTQQPLVSILKKKSSFRSTDASFHSIVKPAKLTDLGTKLDFSALRARHNRSPPAKKSSSRFSTLGELRSISPPLLALPSEKDSGKKFVLPSHSAHSSRVIKPNKRFIDTDTTSTAGPVLPLSGEVLKKPKLIFNQSESNSACHDEAYETCDSSANSNDSSDSKLLEGISKLTYVEKTLGLFGSASVKNATFQDPFMQKSGETDSGKDAADSLSRRTLQTSRNPLETPCTSDQSSTSSSGESSDSEDTSLCSEDEETGGGNAGGVPPSQLLSGKVVLREARLQLSSVSSSGTDGPFSTFGSSPSNSPSPPNTPGTVSCGVCGAVRFYRFVRQARKFGIYSCESCRKFISKMLKKQKLAQNTPLPVLQCLKGEGNCQVPSILRSQQWKLLRCAYKARCTACWLKMCLRAFHIPAPLKQALHSMLPPNMRPPPPTLAADPHTLTTTPNPLRPATPSFASLSSGLDEGEAAVAAAKSKATAVKKATDDEQKTVQSDPPPKAEKSKAKEEKTESLTNVNRKRRHTRIKVRKKDKVSAKQQADSTKRQKMELKGPRVKHVCRSASIVLGQPIATFPVSEDKEPTKDIEMEDSESVEAEKISEEPDLCVGCEDNEEKVKEEEAMEVCKEEEESCDSFSSAGTSETNKENDFAGNKVAATASKDSEVKVVAENEPSVVTVQKKQGKNALANISNLRMSLRMSQLCRLQQRASPSVCLDYWESYDPDEVSSSGWGLMAATPFPVRQVCFLCASRGNQQLIHCLSCCEPYHPFCVDSGLSVGEGKQAWLCPRCVQCGGCGRRTAGAVTSRCRACRHYYHPACLATTANANYRSDWPQMCSACLKCKSCDSHKVSKFLGSLPFCSGCFRLRQKGNYCPLCQGCYQDNDFDSKMMECGWCSRWVHARCEGLSGEGYQLLSALPHSVEYVCKQCQPQGAPWRLCITTHLRQKLINVLKALAKNKSACALLKLTPHKNTPVTNKPCLCTSPVAVRRLFFNEKASVDATNAMCLDNVGKKILSAGIGDKLEDLIPPISNEQAKGTVHKLQESLLQNNEICLSIGPCEVNDRVMDNIREKYRLKDCCVKVRDISQSEDEEKDSENSNDSHCLYKNEAVPDTATDYSTDDSMSDSDTSQINNNVSRMSYNPRFACSEQNKCDTSAQCMCAKKDGDDLTPSLLDVKMRVNSNEYTSVKDFNRDMMEAIERITSPDVKRIYKNVFTEAFPWFNCEMNCLNPSLEIEDDNDDTESLKDEDISEFSDKKRDGNNVKNASTSDQAVPCLEQNSKAIDFTYEDASLHDTRLCILCKKVGEGNPDMEERLLYCGQGDWIHANCALWSAEVFEEIDGSLQNIQSAISRGRMIKCAKCANKGASVGCCAKNCSETYHFTCARTAGCIFLDDKRVFCPQHLEDGRDKALQKEKDFELSRPVYVELDRKKKRYCEPQKVQFLLGSLIVQNLGRIIPSVSDFEDFLIPVDFVCSRLYWSTKQPWKIVKYTIRTKLLVAEPSPAFDLGVNITLDHSMKRSTVDRILAEISSWHKSLETDSHAIMVSKKDKSPMKFGSANVSLEDFAVKQVMEHMLDLVCRQEQDDTPEEEPQNTADLLPPELKDAIFEDLNHDMLDGISMQDIFPISDLISIDLKNEVGFGADVKENKNAESNEDAMAKANDETQDKSKRNLFLSNNNSEHWLDGKTSPQDLLEDLLSNQGESGRELKRSKSELVIQGANLKSITASRSHQRSCSLTLSCKLDGTLTSTIKRCKIPRPGFNPRTESTSNVLMVVDGTSDIVVSLGTPKLKIEEVTDLKRSWQQKGSKSDGEAEDIAEPCDMESDRMPTVEETEKVSDKDENSIDKLEKSNDSTEHVIDFYTKIHCSPIAQLDGAEEDYSSDSDCSSPPMSPHLLEEQEFTPITQLDGADDITSSSSSEGGSPPREQSTTVFFRPNDGQYSAVMSTANLGNMSTSNDLIMRSPMDDNIFRICQVEQTVRCDRCHCTYRTKDSFNRHLATCDMMSTSESEGETPKSPESRTLTTLQNAFNGSFIQPTFVNQQNMVFETQNSEQFGTPKPANVGNRRTSVNTRQITINGTIVETQSPGPQSPNKNEYTNVQDQLNAMNIKTEPQKVNIQQGILPQSHIMVTSQLPISPPRNQTPNGSKGQIFSQANVPYNICVKPAPGLQTIHPSNSTLTQILPNNANIQVLSSNPNQLLISTPQQNIMHNLHGKTPIVQAYSSMPNTQTISVPVNSIQGLPASMGGNIGSFVRPQMTFQNGPTILMPTSCAPRMNTPNMQHKGQMILPQVAQKSPKKPQQVQPKPVFQAAKGRGRTIKTPTIKRQTKIENKPITSYQQNMPMGSNNVIQFQQGNSGQPSIIVQQVGNPNILSYVEAIQQQQGQNMQYIATLAPQGEYKPAPNQYISQGGLMPQTFQIQQTESGGLIAVPSGGIPVFLPQGGVGILPQAQGMTITPQGTIQTQGGTILPQGTIQTQNGTTILPQGTIQTQNGTTILPQGTTIQGLTQGNMQQQSNLVSGNGIQSQGGNINNSQSILPQNQGNTLISQQGGTTIIPQGTILPQGLQFCNDQVLLGSTPTLEMVRDSSGCMYLTTQPVYYGLETIVQNTVMSSQQFVSTAMQGVLAQNSSFSATTTQVFQASKIEPIVEMPTGYVVVNTPQDGNIIVSQPNMVNSQNMVQTQGNSNNVQLQSIASNQNQKNVKTVQGPNITIQPATADKIGVQVNKSGIKTMPMQQNQPIFSLAQPHQVGNTFSLQPIHPRNVSMVQGKPNINIQPMQANILQPGSIQIPLNPSQIPQGSFSVGNTPIHISQPIISSTIASNNNQNKQQPNITIVNQAASQDNGGNDQQQRLQPSWRNNQNMVQASSADSKGQQIITQNSEGQIHKIISSNANAPNSSSNHLIMSTSVSNSRSYATNQFGQPIFTEAQTKLQHSGIDISSTQTSNMSSVSFTNAMMQSNNSVVTVASSLPLCTPYMVNTPMNQQLHAPPSNNQSKEPGEVAGNIGMIQMSNQQISIGNNDNGNQPNKQSNMMMTCGAHRNIPTPVSESNQNNMNVVHLPGNMLNMTMQGEKVYQMSSPNNSMGNSIASHSPSVNNAQNQIGCNIQMHVNNVNRQQNNCHINLHQGQMMNSPNAHIHISNSNANQMHCINNQGNNNACSQHQAAHSNASQSQIINNQHIMNQNMQNQMVHPANQNQMLHGNQNQHAMMNMNTHHQMMSNNSNNQHQMHNSNCANNPNMHMQIISSGNQMQISNNQMHNHSNVCNNNRQMVNQQGHHQIIEHNHQAEGNQSDGNQMIVDNSNERNQINNINQLPMSNTVMNNQMQINNQMQMTANPNSQMLITDNAHCEINMPSNNSQYQVNHDQMFLVNNQTNNQMNSPGNMMQSNMNQHYSQMNQMQMNNSMHGQGQMTPNAAMNQTVHVQNISMPPQSSGKVGSQNQEPYIAKNPASAPNSGMSAETDGAKISHPAQNTATKQINNPVLSISSSNQIGYIQMNSNNNQIMNFPERNHITSSPSASVQVQNNQNRPVITIGHNELITMPRSINTSEVQQKAPNTEMQPLSMPIVNISNGSISMPPLSNSMNKQINLPQHNIGNSCLPQTMPSNQSNQMGLPMQLPQNNVPMQISNVSHGLQNVGTTINLPTQSSSSITLPKAPPHQSGIPTNVVNPIPQSMRPMNRVLPIHRDAQSKAAGKPKKVEPPKMPPPRSQDMPDLNSKDDDMIIDTDLNKAIIESKQMMEIEEQKKTEALIAQTTPSTVPNTVVSLNVSKPSEIKSATSNFKIVIQKNSHTESVYKISSKNMKEKENLSELMKPPSQKIELSKTSKDSINSLKSKNFQRKLHIRSKENISNIKMTKKPPSGGRIPKDDGPKMIYEISSEDGFNCTSTSLADLWTKVFEAVQNARKQHGLAPLQHGLPQSMLGHQILGLHHNALKYLVEQLPGVSGCSKYRSKRGSLSPLCVWEQEGALAESLRESPWGSARAGPAQRKPCQDLFSWLASPYRDPPPPLVITPETDNPTSRRLTTLPMAMRFRNLKETSKHAVGVYRSLIHGRGLFCKRDIDSGEMVIEYAGEVIRAALADQRERRYEAARGGRGVSGCYMFRVDDHLVVDATMKGNAARFINHSCDPNCYSRVVDILGHKHILIFALRRINQGEELTYDYKFPFEDVKIPCTCGAKKCRKYLN